MMFACRVSAGRWPLVAHGQATCDMGSLQGHPSRLQGSSPRPTACMMASTAVTDQAIASRLRRQAVGPTISAGGGSRGGQADNLHEVAHHLCTRQSAKGGGSRKKL
ncbi:hypothetical protein B296_00002249 [Ensete ventricosum]|uniref:Uncharacterized protein n=1 Tax=Ensete ventricosum TaxID=4639 RepID=A0A427AE80_ENSVE|nr:hypothetical protein B296_00002249 [Ensete ventricosum]